MKGNYIYYALCIIFLSGCAKRNLVYFSDLKSKNEISTKILNDGVPKILENDILSITVNTTSPESNLLFAATTTSIGPSGMYEREGFRVNQDGKIKFPVLGEIKVVRVKYCPGTKVN